MKFANLFHPAPRPWTARRVAVNGARLRVLIVDDNHDAALALAAYLSLEDFESRAVFGGDDAVELGIAWSPHVVLMDISMPRCNGYEAARALRRDPRTEGIAIIAHTAFDKIEVRQHLSDSEFDGYVQKGWPPSQLVALITKLAR
ncbi:hypothetical protein R8871_06515 [Paraburkholderia graminis C4D1M]|uniref:Response regulator receiver protein n=1 Tax=Paraburkholderia graminis (strain ATCC 700544 / DSM 17151 / LMG 18924 / NCIMB 13744 / C4D1M) TaxID=396598 RepID=B1G6Y2_PARG4|nr:response regulator [Paraburkholderia graminis]EDT08202.1 response regulator receiver protein [Paraburkholderia graminis C4D1M]CAB3739615.1 hypothetical protein R8871_06515 [Paraburkholderia graminis C4D1M]